MIQLNSNASALNTQHHLQFITRDVSKSIERLSTGYRINNAGDDAAGLQISESLRSQQRGIDAAINNAQDGINVLNIVDGVFEQASDMMQRYRELVVQAANGTNSTENLQALESERHQIALDIDNLARSTEYNGIQIMRNFSGEFNIQIGANDSSTENTLNLNIAGAGYGNIMYLGDETGSGESPIDESSLAGGYAGIMTMLRVGDEYLSDITAKRAAIGAMTNRLEGISQNLMVERENIAATESRIRNADIAEESATLTRNQVRQNAATSMLTQASRQNAQVALGLLQ